MMQHYRQHWPVLMLVPVSMTFQWASELLKFSSDLLRDKDIFIAKKVSQKCSVLVVLCCDGLNNIVKDEVECIWRGKWCDMGCNMVEGEKDNKRG